jgi:NADPH-dependent glutamate synthase beta subunit-like oxidoreductase
LDLKQFKDKTVIVLGSEDTSMDYVRSLDWLTAYDVKLTHMGTTNTSVNNYFQQTHNHEIFAGGDCTRGSSYS